LVGGVCAVLQQRGVCLDSVQVQPVTLRCSVPSHTAVRRHVDTSSQPSTVHSRLALSASPAGNWLSTVRL